MKGRSKFQAAGSKWKYIVIFISVVVLIALLTPAYLSGGSNSQVEAFVSRFYRVSLDRQADQAGLNLWVKDLLAGTKTGSDVAKGFIFSKEFTDKNYSNSAFLTILYKAYFDRSPDAAGFNSWLARLDNGASRETVVNGFSTSVEFAELCSNFGISAYKTTSKSSSTTTVAGIINEVSGIISGSKAGFAAGNKVNFIIWGDDSGLGRPGGRVNGRTDQNHFVHLNLDTGKAIIVPIPRDTWTSIPGHKNGKINGAHAMGGNDLAVRTFEQFTGIKIDFYVITDFDGFIPLIDNLGGVTVNVEENISDDFSGCYLSPGTYTLNGTQALALCRARHGRSLYGGGAFAREYQASMMLIDLLMQKKGLVDPGNPGGFLARIGSFVWSNISMEQAAAIAPVLLSMNYGDVSIQKFNAWPQNFGKASAVGFNTAQKNAFFAGIAAQ